MSARRIIMPAIFLRVGVVLLLTIIKDWQAWQVDEDLFSTQRQTLTADLNAVTNNLVNGCLKALPVGDPACDNLRSSVGESCQLTSDGLDACKDGRVEQYYAGLQAISLDEQTTLVNMTEIVEPASDLRCFQRWSGAYMLINEDSGYWTALYREVENTLCEQESSELLSNNIGKFDLNRVGPDVSADTGKIYYTEYRLLNGTILSFGEKEIIIS